jgi:integrase
VPGAAAVEPVAMPNPRKLSHSRGTSWEITYRVDGQLARRRFPTRAQAVDELAKARVDIARGQGLLPVDAKISVADYTKQWLTTLPVRPSTRAKDPSYLRNHILPALGQRPLSSLRRSHIAAVVARLVDKGLAASTVKHCYDVLSLVMRSACYDQVLHTSPGFKIKLPEIPGRTLSVLNPEQVHALLSAARDCDRAVLATAVGTGLRQGEILGLRLVHLNLLRRQLAVEEQAMSPSGGQPFLTSDLKTPSSRAGPTAPPVRRPRARAGSSRPTAPGARASCSPTAGAASGGEEASTTRCGSRPCAELASTSASASTPCGTPTPRGSSPRTSTRA